MHLWSMCISNICNGNSEWVEELDFITWSVSSVQHGILASGGGTADKTIRFWNTMTGQSLQSIDTGSQVCNLAWSNGANELVSTHGYSQNQIILWRYPSLTQVARLTGHTTRVLYLAMSPDGQTVVTGAGDETLRFWNVFYKSKSHKEPNSPLNMGAYIRWRVKHVVGKPLVVPRWTKEELNYLSAFIQWIATNAISDIIFFGICLIFNACFLWLDIRSGYIYPHSIL